MVADVERPLEAICMKAMALKQADRYPSAAALAEDVQRFLAGEPVSAYRENWWERSKRWARRHSKALTRSAAAALLIAVAAAGVLKWNQIEEKRQTDLRLAEEKRLEEKRIADEKIRQTEEEKQEEERKAKKLQQIADAEKAVVDFHRLADEARFYAANSGPTGDRSPYYDAARAETVTQARPRRHRPLGSRSRGTASR